MSAVQADWQDLGFPSAEIAQLWDQILEPSTTPMVRVACFQVLGQCIVTERGNRPNESPRVSFVSPEKPRQPALAPAGMTPGRVQYTTVSAPTPAPASPPPPPTTPGVKKKIQKEKKAVDPAKISLTAMMKALIKAKEDNKLTETQTTQFETLVSEIRTKGPAAVKKKLQAELREIYKTGVYGK